MGRRRARGLVDGLALPQLLRDLIQGDPSVREDIATVRDRRGRRERAERDHHHRGRDDPHHHHRDQQLDQREAGLAVSR
jgi:hypothetical protein